MNTYQKRNSTHKPQQVVRAAAMALAVYGGFASVSACAPDDLGPKCQEYYGTGNCCLHAAGDNEVAKAACGTTRTSIQDGIKNGQDPASFEGSCGTAMESAQKNGSCLTAATRKCNPSGDACQDCETCDSFCSCQETQTQGQITAADCMTTCE